MGKLLRFESMTPFGLWLASWFLIFRRHYGCERGWSINRREPPWSNLFRPVAMHIQRHDVWCVRGIPYVFGRETYTHVFGSHKATYRKSAWLTMRQSAARNGAEEA